MALGIRKIAFVASHNAMPGSENYGFIHLPRRNIMFATQEQFSSAAKANLEAQFNAASDLASKAFATITQLIDLNISTAKASLEHSTATAQQLLSARDPKEFFTLSAAQTQPAAEKLLAYSRSVATIASATQAEIVKSAEAQVADATRKVNTLIDGLVVNAPAGSENAVAMLKSALNNASSGYEQLTRSVKQATETMEDNFSKASKQFTQPVEKTVSRKK
jgi:phasin family protein